MKKLLLVITAFFVFGRLAAQSIPNGGFENWDVTTWSDPTNYNTSNDQIFTPNVPNPTANVTQVTGWNIGFNGVQLTTTVIDGDTIPGYITNSNGNPFMGVGGIPYSQKPTGVQLWYNANIVPGDTAVFGVVFKKAGHIIGAYEYKIARDTSNYPLLTETFSPALALTPDTVIFAAVSSAGILSSKKEKSFPGTTFTISGIEFTPTNSITPPALLNGAFTSWTTDSLLSLAGWLTEGAVTRTSDAFAGNYALQLQTTNQGNGGNNVQSAFATTGTGTNHYLHPYTLQQDTFQFYYKYTSSLNAADSGNFTLAFDTVGSSSHGPYLIGNQLPPTTGYQLVKQPIGLQTAPDSVYVNFFSFTSSFRSDSLKDVGSTLEVDNAEFQSQQIATGIKPVLLDNNMLLIYPNPAVSQFTIASAQAEINEVRLQNILGETVLDKQFAEGDASMKQIIDVSNLSSGLYFISITSDNKTSTGKITVSR